MYCLHIGIDKGPYYRDSQYTAIDTSAGKDTDIAVDIGNDIL